MKPNENAKSEPSLPDIIRIKKHSTSRCELLICSEFCPLSGNQSIPVLFLGIYIYVINNINTDTLASKKHTLCNVTCRISTTPICACRSTLFCDEARFAYFLQVFAETSPDPGREHPQLCSRVDKTRLNASFA